MNKRALIIGLNYFNSEEREIGNHELAKNASNLYRERLHVTDQKVLLDGQKKVTKMDILNSFDNLLKDTNRGDVLIFHFVGKSVNNKCIICGNADEQITNDEFCSFVLDPLPELVTLFLVFDSSMSGLNLRYSYEDFSSGKLTGKSSGLFKTCTNLETWKSESKIIERGHISPLHTNVFLLSSRAPKGILTSAIVHALETIYAYSITIKLLLTHIRSTLRVNGCNESPILETGQHLDINLISLGDILSAPI